MAESKKVLTKAAYTHIVDKIRANCWAIRDNASEHGKEVLESVNPFIEELFSLSTELSGGGFEIRDDDDEMST